MRPVRLAAALAAALVLAGPVATAGAANLRLAGTLGFDTDVVRIDFTLASAGAVVLWTDSWRAGLNFDPTLALFDAAARLVSVGDDTPDPATLRPNQGGYDATLDFGTLAAGRYLLALTASGNDALGPTFADGFSLAGTTPMPIALWNQPSYDINKNDQKGGAWSLHLDGVSTAVVVAAPVPEPSTWALTGLGFAAIAWRLRRRSGDRSTVDQRG